MIIKEETTTHVIVTCDSCGRQLHFEPTEYYEFFERLKGQGWTFRVAGDWHLAACPACKLP